MSVRSEGAEGAATQNYDNSEGLSFSHLLSAHADQFAVMQSQLRVAYFRMVNRLELQIQCLSQDDTQELSKRCGQGEDRHQGHESQVVDIISTARGNWQKPVGYQSPPAEFAHIDISKNTSPLTLAIQPQRPAPSQLPSAWTSQVFGDELSIKSNGSLDMLTLDGLPGQTWPQKEADECSICLPVSDVRVQDPQPPKEVLPRLGSISSQSNMTSVLPVAAANLQAPAVMEDFPEDLVSDAMSCNERQVQDMPCEILLNNNRNSVELAPGPSKDDSDSNSSDHSSQRPNKCRQDASDWAFRELAPIWLTQVKPAMVRKSDLSHASHLTRSVHKGAATMSRSLSDSFAEKSSLQTQTPIQLGTRFVLHPGSWIAHVWDLFGLLFLLYDLAVVPLDLLEMDRSPFIDVMSWIICIFWTLTMGFACCRGYFDEDGSAIFERAKLIQRYAFTWLLPDLLALCFSWVDLVVNCHGADGTNLWVSVFRLIRIMRLVRAPAVVGLTFERARSDRGVLLTGVFKIVSLIVGYAHITACLWYFVGRLETDNDLGWVEQAGLQTEPLPNRYLSSFFWAMSAFVGEVTLVPSTPAEQGYTAFVILLSFLISASFVSSLTTSMTQLQIVSSQQSANVSALRQYLSENDVSRNLAVKLMRNAQHSLEADKRRATESSIVLLKSISEPLLAELHFEIRGRHLAVHPLLRRYMLINASGLKKVCHIGCQFHTFALGDTVFSEFEVPASPRMLFIIEGKLTYRSVKDTDASRVVHGEWTSEGALWMTSWTHLGTLTSNCESQVMALHAQSFQRTVHTYPTAHLKVYARIWIDYIKRLSEERRLTDLCVDESEMDSLADDAFRIAEDEELSAHGSALHGSLISSLSHMSARGRSSQRSVVGDLLQKRLSPGSAGGSKRRLSTMSMLNPFAGPGRGVSERRGSIRTSVFGRWM